MERSIIDVLKGGLNDNKLLKIFNGRQEDWPIWKEKFEAIMDMAGVLDVLLPGNTRPDGGEERVKWDSSSRSVYGRLVLFTSGTPLGLVKQHRRERDGVRAWAALVDKYEQKGEVRMSALHNELINGEMLHHKDPEEYFLRLEELQDQLKDLNVTVDNAMLKGIVTAKMPPSYDPLRAVIDTMKSLEYEELKGHVRAYYARNIANDVDSGKHEKALLAHFSGNCFRCGGRGHKKHECPDDDNRDTGKLKCDYCGKTGPIEKKCWTKKKSSQASHMAMGSLGF